MPSFPQVGSPGDVKEMEARAGRDVRASFEDDFARPVRQPGQRQIDGMQDEARRSPRCQWQSGTFPEPQDLVRTSMRSSQWNRR